ncbi:hypothetical protein PGTUg99_000196 [Puccinia graminis f. sp. tritici]|uniref:Uncharacterized protein n=1 Tax=Puccinia graminis f. sp. tritici TaxID=56615 RepID=A0A5B0RY01_PUCGR|nr:hypothetical protein PGTUg99_000196 [Puccinia graminis f. sp. tritici]
MYSRLGANSVEVILLSVDHLQSDPKSLVGVNQSSSRALQLSDYASDLHNTSHLLDCFQHPNTRKITTLQNISIVTIFQPNNIF